MLCCRKHLKTSNVLFSFLTEKLLLWVLKWKGKTNKCFNGLKMEDQGVQSPQTFLVKNFSFLQLLRKRKVCACFQVSLNTDCRYKAASWTLEYKNDNVQYYFEVQFNFYNDWESHIR